jgi:HK97 gp10 family phage protein
MSEIQGLDRILARLEEVANADGIRQAMGKACALVEREAKQKAPKDTGELRRSITSEVKEEGGEIQGIVFTPLEYAPYVEYGTGLFAEEGGRLDVPWNYQDDRGEWHSTSGQKPQPFMRPALDENKEEIKRILQEGLSND